MSLRLATSGMLRTLRTPLWGAARRFYATGVKKLFTKEHEWVELQGDTGVMGVSEHAAHELGDIVFVDLPETGRKLVKGTAFSAVESVKAASDVFAPCDGEVTESNAVLSENPALVNENPEGEGWIIKFRTAPDADFSDLMNEEAYKKFLEE